MLTSFISVKFNTPHITRCIWNHVHISVLEFHELRCPTFLPFKEISPSHQSENCNGKLQKASIVSQSITNQTTNATIQGLLPSYDLFVEMMTLPFVQWCNMLITTQKVLFYSLKLTVLNTFKQQLIPFNLIGTLRNLAKVTNQFLTSFDVFGNYLIIETS